MKIRREQASQLAAFASLSFENRLIEFLNDKYPETEELPRDDFRNVVREQIGKAQTYGFETEQQFATYVHAAWVLGRDFDTRFPAAAEHLSSPASTAQGKCDWLSSWTKALLDALSLPE